MMSNKMCQPSPIALVGWSVSSVTNGNLFKSIEVAPDLESEDKRFWVSQSLFCLFMGYKEQFVL